MRPDQGVASTLIELLRQRASQQAEHPGYTFLLDGETAEARMTWAELDRRARGLGAALQHLGARDERALLLYPPGLAQTARERTVLWLPPYHDMGLIGGILEPLYAGYPVTLMSPLAFLQQPVRWLRAVSRTRATTSGGPNFAYDLCVHKISEEQRRELDLSSWSLAFNGAEPVRPETLERFAAAFEPCGFRREAFFPCYGLAEATLLVSASRRQEGASVHVFAAAGLQPHRA